MKIEPEVGNFGAGHQAKRIQLGMLVTTHTVRAAQLHDTDLLGFMRQCAWLFAVVALHNDNGLATLRQVAETFTYAGVRHITRAFAVWQGVEEAAPLFWHRRWIGQPAFKQAFDVFQAATT